MFETETPTNPVGEVDESAPQQEVEQPVEQIEDSDGQEPEPQANPADDMDEIEHEGKKYRVPKAIKPLVMMQQDYTRKTQSLAEEKRTFEQQRLQFAEASQAHFKDLGKLMALDDQLEQWKQVNWQQLSDQDPQRAQSLWFQYNQLKDQRQALVGELQQKEQQRQAAAQQDYAKRIADARSFVAREIPGWSEELDVKLTNFAVSQGLTREQAAQIAINTPAAYKIVHLAYLGQQLLEKQKAAASKPAPAPAPVPNVTTSRAPAAKDPERMTTEEWMRYRNKQVASRGL